jgi:hypothetical protein
MRPAHSSRVARVVGLATVLPMLACSPSNAVEPEDVLELECAGSCDAFADGESVITLRACTPVTERRKGLSVLFTATVGTWTKPKDKEPAASEVPLGRDRCVTADFIPPRKPGEVSILAELGGIRREVVVQLAPVDVGRVEVTPQPALLATKGPTTVIVNAIARATRGAPSEGTTVSFAIGEREPAGAHAVIFPSSVRADSDGRASATLTVASGTRLLLLRIDAETPGATGSGEDVLLFGEGGAPP